MASSGSIPRTSTAFWAIGGQVETWSIKGGGGWDHPVHAHFEEGVVLSRNGKEPPAWEKWDAQDPTNLVLLPAVEPGWDGVEFKPSFMDH